MRALRICQTLGLLVRLVDGDIGDITMTDHLYTSTHQTLGVPNGLVYYGRISGGHHLALAKIFVI